VLLFFDDAQGHAGWSCCLFDSAGSGFPVSFSSCCSRQASQQKQQQHRWHKQLLTSMVLLLLHCN
jgi:hypothetical protein